MVGPTIKARDRQIRREAREAIRSAAGEVTAPWWAKHRRWHSAATKVVLVRAMGGKRYQEMFPW